MGLTIPGLMEKRPPLVTGNRIHVRLRIPGQEDSDNIAYEGIITDIKDDDVIVDYLIPE